MSNSQNCNDPGQDGLNQKIQDHEKQDQNFRSSPDRPDDLDRKDQRYACTFNHHNLQPGRNEFDRNKCDKNEFDRSEFNKNKFDEFDINAAAQPGVSASFQHQEAAKDSQKKQFSLLNHLSLWLGIAAVLAVLSCLCGSSWMSFTQMIQALMDPGSPGYAILVHVRLPRMLGCLICGPALAMAGYVLQSLLHNSLAAPHTMGLQAGAGMAVALCGFLPAAFRFSSLAAFGGCLFAGFCILFLAQKAQASKTTLILAGLAMSQIFSAGIDLLVTLNDDVLMGYTSFKIGSLAGLSLQALILPTVLVGVCAGFLLMSGNELEIMSLGSDSAMSLGLNASLWMKLYLIVICLLCACVVSLSGLIGFIGLITPHMVKKTITGSSTRQLAACILQGACCLLLCDLLARTLFTPFEIPTGIILSLFGGPYFLWLLFGMRRRRHG